MGDSNEKLSKSIINPNDLRTLEGIQKWGYSCGILGQILPNTLINSFIAIFWIYVVGLDALMVSVATALGSLTNAFAAPIFGYLSDKRTYGKLGKRKPYLLYGILPSLLCIIFMWVVPHDTESFGVRDWGLFVYITIFTVSYYISFAMTRSSYLAMLPEQSEVEQNRIQISSLQGLFAILATVIGILLPMILMAGIDEPKQIYANMDEHQSLKDTLWVLGLVFGIIATIFTLITVVTVDETHLKVKEEEKLNNTEQKKENQGIKNVFSSIFKPMGDKQYRKFLLTNLFQNASVRILIKMIVPFFTYVLLMEGDPFVLFMVFEIPFAVGGFLIWQKKAKREGLKKPYLQSNIGMTTAMFAAFLVYLIPAGNKTARQAFAFIIFAVVLFNLVTGYLLPNPIISALTDNSPKDLIPEKDSKSGSYFGAFLFSVNIANAIGDIIIGLMLMKGRAKNDLYISLLMPIAAILFLLGTVIFSKIKNESFTIHDEGKER